MIMGRKGIICSWLPALLDTKIIRPKLISSIFGFLARGDEAGAQLEKIIGENESDCCR